MKKFSFLCFFAMLLCGINAHAAAELTFSNVSVPDGSKLEAIAQNQKITFNTNMDDAIGYMLAQIEDETGTVVLSSTTVYDPNFNNNGDGHASNVDQNKKDPHFTFVCPSTTKMTEGHTYKLVLTAYVDKAAAQGAGNVLAKGSISYVGAAAAYIPSPFKLLSITPEPNTYVIKGNDVKDDASKRTVTLTFNNKVRLDEATTNVSAGTGFSVPFEKIVPGDDAEKVVTYNAAGEEISTYTYSSTWSLTIAYSSISAGVAVTMSANAYDKSGLHVVATGSESLESYLTNAGETGYFSFTLNNETNAKALNITPASDNEYVNSLYSFKVTDTTDGVAQAGIAEKAVLYQVDESNKKTQVAEIVTVVDDKIIYGNGSTTDDKTVAQRLFLDKAITKAGKYILHFPSNYFIFGSGMQAAQSAETDIEYTIKEDLAEVNANVKGGKTEVTKLAEVTIQYPDYEQVDPCGDGDWTAYVLNENNELVTKADLGYGEEYNEILVTMKTPVTTPGNYKLIIPQDAVCVANPDYESGSDRGEGDDNDDTFVPEYILLGAVSFDFTVVPGSIEGIVATPDIENNSTVKSIDAVKITFANANNEDVTVEVVGFDTDAFWKGVAGGMYASEASADGNVATIKPYTGGRNKVYGISADGTYSVTFPEGFFSVNGNDWPAMTLTYIVDSTTGIDGVDAGASIEAKTVYTLTGIKVADSIKNLKGTFIVNGKKVVLK